MKAIYMTGPDAFSLQVREDPAPGRNDVLIQVRLAGVCGSDLYLLRGRNPFVQYPVIPGHEFSGEVLKAPVRSGLKKGDRVTVFPEVGCGRCRACREGRFVHCPQFKIIGVHLPGGGFCERVVAHSRSVFRLPKTMPYEVGAMVEPTAVAVHTNRRAGVRRGSKVVIIGGGPIGLLAAQVARAYGAVKVVLSEPIDRRREIARALGFGLICDPAREDLPFFVKKHLGSAEAVFDIVGTEKTLDDSLSILCPDGKLIPLALPHKEEMGLPYRPIFAKELHIIGSRTYFKHDFSEAIRLLRAGKVRVQPLISHILPLERFAEAVEQLEKNPAEYVKVLIQP